MSTVLYGLTFAIGAALGFVAWLTLPPSVQEHVIAPSTVDIVRTYFGIIGAILFALSALIGAGTYLMAQRKQRQVASASATIDLLHDETAALRTRLQTTAEDGRTMQLLVVAKDAELAALRGKTDLTQVLTLQADMIAQNREHDAQVTAGLGKMMELLSAQSMEYIRQSKETFVLLTGLARTADSLGRKLGAVDKQVSAIAENTSTDLPDDPGERRKADR